MSDPVSSWPLPTTAAFLFEFATLSAPTMLYDNTLPQIAAIVTSMDVCNVGGAIGDGFQVVLDGTAAVCFQAQRGSGSFDDFPYRGSLIIPPGRQLFFEPAGGTWDLVGFGILQPLLFP